MVEPPQDSPSQPASSSNISAPTQAANLHPSSNVHVVEPGHLAADASRDHKKRRSLIILLVLLGVAFVAGFIFLTGWYYLAIYSKPKVFTTECFELTLPGFYNVDTTKDNNDVDMSKACNIGQAAFGRGGVSAVQQKKSIDTSKLSLEEYTQKALKIQTAAASTGQLESREQVKLDGVEAWCEVYLGKDGMRTIQYHGVRDGKFFIVGWVYNTTNSQAKSDIENSIASFRWR